MLAREVALRHRGCPRAIFASLEAAPVARSAFLAGQALRRGERWRWGLPAQVCLAVEPRPGLSDRVVAKLEGPPVLARPVFAEAADSAVWAGFRPEATLSGAHWGRPSAVSLAPSAMLSEARWVLLLVLLLAVQLAWVSK